MNYHDFLVARDLERQDLPFYALVQAAMRRASNGNLEKLQLVFPEVWQDLQARYQAAGGLLPEEWAAGMRPHDGYLWPVAQAAAQDLVIGDDGAAVEQDLVLDDETG